MSAKLLTIQETMQRLGGREFFQQLREHISIIANATGETGGKGKLTISIETSKPKGSTLDDPMVQFKTQIVPKLPAAPARVTHLYVSDAGLHTQDPRQEQMDFRVIEGAPSEVRSDGAAAPIVKEA